MGYEKLSISNICARKKLYTQRKKNRNTTFGFTFDMSVLNMKLLFLDYCKKSVRGSRAFISSYKDHNGTMTKERSSGKPEQFTFFKLFLALLY